MWLLVRRCQDSPKVLMSELPSKESKFHMGRHPGCGLPDLGPCGAAVRVLRGRARQHGRLRRLRCHALARARAARCAQAKPLPAHACRGSSNGGLCPAGRKAGTRRLLARRVVVLCLLCACSGLQILRGCHPIFQEDVPHAVLRLVQHRQPCLFIFKRASSNVARHTF